MVEFQQGNGGGAIHWKKFGFHLALLFFVSLGSSVSTWYVLSRQPRETSWQKILDLTPDQEKKFAVMESDFNLALKQIAAEDAQNKIALCSYLHSEKMEPKDIEDMTKKMAGLYEQKQKTLATSLMSISNLLTPEQRKKFSTRLMHEICVSCKKTTGTEQCICGMCEHHT
jgi:Spy/CpxP family protein refolding chaperone